METLEKKPATPASGGIVRLGGVALALAGAVLATAGIRTGFGFENVELTFVAASALLVFGAVALVVAYRRPPGLRLTDQPAATVATALVCAALIPVVYSGAMAYGSAWLEWDAEFSTWVSVERPGGIVVIAVAIMVCLVLVCVCLTALSLAALAFARRIRRSDPFAPRGTW